MRILELDESNQVGGGFWAALIALGAIFTLPKVINDARKDYNQWGQNFGEYMWESRYPYDPNNPQFPYR